jgi:hypothetical protein
MDAQKVTNKILLVDNFSDRLEYVRNKTIDRLTQNNDGEQIGILQDFDSESNKIFEIKSNFYFFKYLQYCELLDIIPMNYERNTTKEKTFDTTLMTGILFTDSSDVESINIDALKIACKPNRFILFSSLLGYNFETSIQDKFYLKFIIEKKNTYGI